MSINPGSLTLPPSYPGKESSFKYFAVALNAVRVVDLANEDSGYGVPVGKFSLLIGDPKKFSFWRSSSEGWNTVGATDILETPTGENDPKNADSIFFEVGEQDIQLLSQLPLDKFHRKYK